MTQVSLKDGGAVFAPDETAFAAPQPKMAKRGGRGEITFASEDDVINDWRRVQGSGAEIEGIFRYRNPEGEPIALTIRFRKSKGGKVFLPASRTEDGRWRNKAPATPRPLYRLDRLADEELVVFTEGEKCADAAASCGFDGATTTWGGAGKAAHADLEPVAGKRVAILPDHDQPGREHADDLARRCWAAGARSVRVVDLTERWPDLKPKGDLADILETAGDDGAVGEAVRELIDAAPEAPQEPLESARTAAGNGWTLRSVSLAEVTSRPVEWLWPGRIARGKMTLIAGHPGLGKSFATLDIAARASTGKAWPDGGGKREPGDVVLLNAEDDVEDTVRPRLDAAGADLHRITSIGATVDPNGKEMTFSLRDHIELLRGHIDAVEDPALVVIDPLNAFLAGTDSHKDADVRSVLAPLARLAEETRVAVVVVAHLNKGGNGGAAVTRVSGSIAFVGAARAAWLVTADREDQERRLFVSVKNNLARDAGGLAYRIADDAGAGPHVEWEDGVVNISADEALRGSETGEHEATERERAAEWLRDYLSDGNPVASIELFHVAKGEGFSEKTVRRALEAIGAESVKDGFDDGWSWRLPA